MIAGESYYDILCIILYSNFVDFGRFIFDSNATWWGQTES